MSNLISERVADFLKRYPPFNDLTQRDLDLLSLEVTIIYLEKGRSVFTAGESVHTDFYVVNKGAVDLRTPGSGDIVDICDEGDIFGLRPLVAGDDYKMDAKAREESILYGIPISTFRPYVETYSEVGNFLLESFAANTRNPYSGQYADNLFATSPVQRNNRAASRYHAIIPIKPAKELVSCKPTTQVREVANLMTGFNVGSVLVLDGELPAGIITDKDLRSKVATGKYPITAPASDIMSQPVITYPIRMTITQAQLAMMKNDISHLCLTEDGTPNSPVYGILSKYDLLLAMGNNPEVLMRAIKRARKMKRLKSIREQVMILLREFMDNNIPMSITVKLISELNDACVKRVVALAVQKQGPPPADFAWLSMGSLGRGEQMLLTDQDNALVYADVEGPGSKDVAAYFSGLAVKVTGYLHEIGYSYCPAEMMASNPDWCLPLSAWKNRVSQWIVNPGKEEVLLSSIFFDYNLSYGHTGLVRELSDHILGLVNSYPIFFYHLATGALQNPSPTGFFRQFLVEQDGKHKDQFDLKLRALMPITDAARVLILSHGVKSINNTAERYEKLAELEPNNRDLFLACSYASKALLKFRTRQGLLHADSGRYIAINSLGKEEKIKLKRTFKTIRDVQELLAIRFNVSNLPA